MRDRSAPLSWSWEAGADEAELIFSNCLTAVMSTTVVARVRGDSPHSQRGVCPHPQLPPGEEGLLVVTLVQTAHGEEIARETVELAYVPGTGLTGTSHPIVVRTDGRAWRRVESPRLAGYDARWWNVTGASGYDVLWAEPPGLYRVERTFEGVGTVDEVLLKFGLWHFSVILK